MNTIKQVVAATLFALSLPLASTAMADGHYDTKQSDQKGSHCQKHGGDQAKHGWHHSTSYGVKHMMHGLNLTAAQKDQVFTIMHAQAPVMREHRKQYWALKKDLNAVTQATPFDDAKAQQIANQIATLEQTKVITRARTHAKLLALLTPEQREESRVRMEKMREAHAQHASHKMHGNTWQKSNWKKGNTM